MAEIRWSGTAARSPSPGVCPVLRIHEVERIGVSRLLVVEHHNATRRSLKTYLSTALPDACVLDAENAMQALEMISKELPDLVIMAFSLPQMSGVEATWEIKRRWHEVHVLMLIMEPNQSGPALAAGAAACCRFSRLEALRGSWKMRAGVARNFE